MALEKETAYFILKKSGVFRSKPKGSASPFDRQDIELRSAIQLIISCTVCATLISQFVERGLNVLP